MNTPELTHENTEQNNTANDESIINNNNTESTSDVSHNSNSTTITTENNSYREEVKNNFQDLQNEIKDPSPVFVQNMEESVTNALYSLGDQIS